MDINNPYADFPESSSPSDDRPHAIRVCTDSIDARLWRMGQPVPWAPGPLRWQSRVQAEAMQNGWYWAGMGVEVSGQIALGNWAAGVTLANVGRTTVEPGRVRVVVPVELAPAVLAEGLGHHLHLADSEGQGTVLGTTAETLQPQWSVYLMATERPGVLDHVHGRVPGEKGEQFFIDFSQDRTIILRRFRLRSGVADS